MTKEQMHELYTRHIDAENRRDLQGCMDTYHRDCYFEQGGFGLRFDGYEAVKAHYAQVFSETSDNRVDLRGFAYGDDVLVSWANFTMEIGEHFMGVPARAGTYQMRGMTIVPFKQGLMEAERVFPDLLPFCAEAGISVDALQARFREMMGGRTPRLPPL